MAGMVSLGKVNAGFRWASGTLGGVSWPDAIALIRGGSGGSGATTGIGAGGALTVVTDGRFQSNGVLQRSHQMLMPGLGWRQAGQAMGVPIAFPFEPSFSIVASSVPQPLLSADLIIRSTIQATYSSSSVPQ
jgi:hypothetical protein